MPDRAVVDDDLGFVPSRAVHPVTFEVQRVFHGQPSSVGLPEPQPRALVALSEDRQWLVTPDPAGHPLWFVFHWEETATDVGWMVQDKMIEAAGQDAHAVLARWLEGRGG